MKLCALIATALLSCGCTASSSLPPTTARPPLGELQILKLTPEAGSALTGDSVIGVDIHYEIPSFEATDEYVLVPLFNLKIGPGTFNEIATWQDALRIRNAAGEIHFDYPIRAEWRSGKLAIPIVLHYSIQLKTGTGRSRAVATSKEFTFPEVNER